MNNICHWKENEHEVFETECGHDISRKDSASDRLESGFCPFCKGEIDSTIHLSREDIEAERGDRAYQQMKDDEE